MVVAFKSYGRPLEAVSGFKYFYRVLIVSDDDCTDLVVNLSKARR